MKSHVYVGTVIYAAITCRGEKKSQLLQDTFRGAVFGGLTDKYGNHWLLHYNKEPGK